METEKIDVPKFYGFECVGITEPRLVNDCYILSADGLDIVSVDEYQIAFSSRTQLCYRKIKPKRITFEMVDKRAPKRGDQFMSIIHGKLDIATCDYDDIEIREIYRVVEDQS